MPLRPVQNVLLLSMSGNLHVIMVMFFVEKGNYEEQGNGRGVKEHKNQKMIH